MISVEMGEYDSHNRLPCHLVVKISRERKNDKTCDVCMKLMCPLFTTHLFKCCADLLGDLTALESVNDDDALLALQHDAVRQAVTNRHVNILTNFQYLCCCSL